MPDERWLSETALHHGRNSRPDTKRKGNDWLLTLYHRSGHHFGDGGEAKVIGKWAVTSLHVVINKIWMKGGDWSIGNGDDRDVISKTIMGWSDWLVGLWRGRLHRFWGGIGLSDWFVGLGITHDVILKIKWNHLIGQEIMTSNWGYEMKEGDWSISSDVTHNTNLKIKLKWNEIKRNKCCLWEYLNFVHASVNVPSDAVQILMNLIQSWLFILQLNLSLMISVTTSVL